MLHVMNTHPASLGALIGSRVRSERHARGWTLVQLAERSGVSRRMLVNIEQSAANPSIGTLLRLSDALGIGLPALVAPPETAAVEVVRRGERSPLWEGDHGGQVLLAAGTAAPDVVELWDWMLGPGDVHTSEAHAEGTRELMLVVGGSVVLSVAGEDVELGVGDAATFRGDAPHAYRNTGAVSAHFALTVFESGVGAGGRA